MHGRGKVHKPCFSDMLTGVARVISQRNQQGHQGTEQEFRAAQRFIRYRPLVVVSSSSASSSSSAALYPHCPRSSRSSTPGVGRSDRVSKQNSG